MNIDTQLLTNKLEIEKYIEHINGAPLMSYQKVMIKHTNDILKNSPARGRIYLAYPRQCGYTRMLTIMKDMENNNIF